MSKSRALAVADGRRSLASATSPTGQPPGLRVRLRGPAWFGFLVILVLVGGFGVWGATAPLAGGAVAPGVISPDGSRRTVQHLEGGIIRALHVRDGDVVKAGQPLLDLEGVQPRATYEMLLGQYRSILATYARLMAEQASRPAIEFPVELGEGIDSGNLRAVLDGQIHLFQTRRETHAARKRVLRQKIEQSREQIKAHEAQVESTTLQLALIADELVGKQEIYRKGLLPKPELRRLERAQAEIVGKRAEHRASIARTSEQIGETDLQLLTLDAERADEIANRIDEVRTELATIKEKLFASEDVLKRTVIVAPVNGIIVNLQFKTTSGVLKPGEAILDIVPGDEALRVDARVSPVDIDVVHVGLSAQVHLSAYSNRSLPRVRGVVVSVSADRLVDDRAGQPYFLARVEVDRDELSRITPKVELVPGMPAEVLIVTGERTMVEYLLQPLLDTIRRGLREV